jgi:hypothetical protein
MPPTKHTHVTLWHDGISVFCDGIAFDPTNGRLIALSLLGYRTSVKAIWAALLSKQWVEYKTPHGESRGIFRDVDANYRTLTTYLTESGTVHAVIIDNRATVLAEPNESFFVLALPGEPEPDAAGQRRFAAMFDRLMTVPVQPAWMPYLWQHGKKKSLILSSNSSAWTSSFNFTTWRIVSDRDRWLAIVEQGIQTGGLTK